MDLDANIQKYLSLVLKKWRTVIIFAVIGAIFAVFYTANFTKLSYTSGVTFLTYAVDTKQEFSDSGTSAQTVSNTSKMNYAIKMLSTNIELFKTNRFNQSVADKLNKKYSADYSARMVKNSVVMTPIEDTAMFTVTVTTNDPELSYRIAKQFETSIPEKLSDTNSGLINASVEDDAVKPVDYESKGYVKKTLIGTAAGIVLAVVYIILRDLFDIRVKSSDEISQKYNVPVLGTIPEFEIKNSAMKSIEKKSDKSKGGV